MSSASKSRTAFSYSVRFKRRTGCCRGGAEARNGGDIFGAGTHAPLLPAAFDQRLERDRVVATDQRADALRTAQLMGGDRNKIRAQGADIARNFAGRLHRIRMQKPTGRMYGVGHCRDHIEEQGLPSGARFFGAVEDGDAGGRARERGEQRLGREGSVQAHPHEPYPLALRARLLPRSITRRLRR